MTTRVTPVVECVCPDFPRRNSSTCPQHGRVVVDQAEVSRQLLALTILGGRIKERADDLRDEVSSWEAGTQNPLSLPDPGNPRRPYQVGVVRCDRGNTTAFVSDRAAFEAWTRENSSHNVVIEAEHENAPTEPGNQRHLDALETAFAEASRRAAGPFPEDPAEVLWRSLRAAGLQLVAVERVPERLYVQPGYEHEVLRLSKAEGEPMAPGGLIPAGVTVSAGDAKAVVVPVRDRAVQDGFLGTLGRQSLLVLAGLAEGDAAAGDSR